MALGGVNEAGRHEQCQESSTRLLLLLAQGTERACHRPHPALPSPALCRPDFFLDLWLIEGRAVVLSRLLVALGFPVSRLLDCPCTRQHN